MKVKQYSTEANSAITETLRYIVQQEVGTWDPFQNQTQANGGISKLCEKNGTDQLINVENCLPGGH